MRIHKAAYASYVERQEARRREAWKFPYGKPERTLADAVVNQVLKYRIDPNSTNLGMLAKILSGHENYQGFSRGEAVIQARIILAGRT